MSSFDDWPTELKLIFIINVIIIGVGILFHTLGIILIMSKSSEMSNQSILLVHLSVISFLALGTNMYAVHQKSYHILYSHVFITLYYTAYITYILNLILLTFDRLLMAFLNIRYEVFVTKTKTWMSLTAVWFIAIGYGFMVKYAPFYKNTTVFVENESFIYNGFVVCFTAIAYAAIAMKIKISASEVHSARLTRESTKKYIIPLVIVISFFLFNMLPSIVENKIQHHLTKTQNRHLTVALIGVNCLNNLVDAVVYIFLQNSIRRRLRIYLRKYMCIRCQYKVVNEHDNVCQRASNASSNDSSVRGIL